MIRNESILCEAGMELQFGVRMEKERRWEIPRWRTATRVEEEGTVSTDLPETFTLVEFKTAGRR